MKIIVPFVSFSSFCEPGHARRGDLTKWRLSDLTDPVFLSSRVQRASDLAPLEQTEKTNYCGLIHATASFACPCA